MSPDTNSRLKVFARAVDATIRDAIARRQDEGVVPFYNGRFAKTADRASFAARTYYEASQLKELASSYMEHDSPKWPGRAVDIGCGYGRLTPHIADIPHIDSIHGVEPNDAARTRAANLYPFLTFSDGTAQDIPYPDDHFDLAVTWTVLQHVNDDDIDAAAVELERVVRPGGYLLTCDKTAGEGTAVVHPRPVDRYEELLDGFELVNAMPRAIEPTKNHSGENTVMVFKRVDGGA